MTTEAAPATAPLPDPSPRLNAAFVEVSRCMAGLGLLNPALQVEAVAFEPWQGHWLGVMVTPWFMNLMLLPRQREQWQPLAVGAKRKLRFPAGIYEFIGADDAMVGQHQTCSLFSPMLEFEDQAAARLVARLAREALFDAANAEVAEFPRPNLSPCAPSASTAAAGGDSAAATPAVAVSKRDFLRGRLRGSSDVDRR